MANHAILNEEQHRDLRVLTGHGEQYGDDVMFTLAIPSEFCNLVSDYPIFLHRDSDSGRLLPMAMFGFEEGENLFLDESGWHAGYVPLMMQRGPFMIGIRGEERQMVVTIDTDSPRVGSEGEPLFQPFGGNSDYTEQIIEILQAIDRGQPQIEEFCRLLEEHGLVEPFSLEVTLNSGKKYRLEGFYTISEERLSALDGAVLSDLGRRGMLHAAYMVLASMANIPRLIELRNRREQAGR